MSVIELRYKQPKKGRIATNADQVIGQIQKEIKGLSALELDDLNIYSGDFSMTELKGILTRLQRRGKPKTIPMFEHAKIIRRPDESWKDAQARAVQERSQGIEAVPYTESASPAPEPTPTPEPQISQTNTEEMSTEPTPTPEPIKFEEGGIVPEEPTPTPTPEPTPDPVASEAAVPEFNPIIEPVVQRSYNQVEYTTDPTPIPEAEFSSPIDGGDHKALESEQMNFGAIPDNAGPTAEPTPSPEQKSPSLSDIKLENPALNEMSDADKNASCEQLVDTVLGGYEMLHTIARKLVKYDPNKIAELRHSGEIHANAAIPLATGDFLTPEGFVEEYNEQVDETLTYDPEFGERVRPAMVRVFKKRNWGLSDEQFLAIEFGKDISFKAFTAMGMKKSVNMIMEQFVVMSDQIRAGATHEEPAAKPDHIVKPPVQETRPEAEPETTENVEETFEEPEIVSETE